MDKYTRRSWKIILWTLQAWALLIILALVALWRLEHLKHL